MNTIPVPGSCCTPLCDEIPNVQVPGTPGSDGAAGAAGADGVNAYTTTTAAFAMPAEGATVSVSVLDSSWMVIGQTLYVQTAGFMEVSSLPNANTAVLRNPENTAASTYASNAAPGTNIPGSSKVAPGGLQGPSGTLSGAAGGDLKGNYPNPLISKANAKGALLVGDATDVQTFTVGANGLMLHADSGQPLGVIWRAIDLTGATSTLSGSLPIARGGTGQTTQTAAYDALSPNTTRGDATIMGAAGDNVRLPVGAANTVWQSNGTDPSYAKVSAAHLDTALARVAVDYILMREEQASGTDAGAFTSGAWRTRALNTETTDVGGYAAVAASQVTLQAGTYRFKGLAGAYMVGNHKVKLRNVTDAIDYLGMNARASATDDCASISTVEGRFTIASAKVFELQHQCQTTKATDGLGRNASFGQEVYATLEFWREAA